MLTTQYGTSLSGSVTSIRTTGPIQAGAAGRPAGSQLGTEAGLLVVPLVDVDPPDVRSGSTACPTRSSPPATRTRVRPSVTSTATRSGTKTT